MEKKCREEFEITPRKSANIIDRTASFIKKIFTSPFKRDSKTARNSFDVSSPQSRNQFDFQIDLQASKPRPTFAINLKQAPTPLEIIIEPMAISENEE